MTRKEVIGECELYLGDCLEILPEIGKVDAVVTDPPYGILADSGSAATRRSGHNLNNGVCEWDRDIGPERLELLLNMSPHSLVWGGCHMGLPPTFGYLVWEKGCAGLNFGEVEFCWTNLRFAPRFLHCRAAGMDGGKKHPTQKPLAVMRWCLSFVPDAQTILDPFMGSGTTGVACIQLDRKFIGIEIEPKYFDIARRRIEDAYKQPKLFSEKPRKPEQQSLLDNKPEMHNNGSVQKLGPEPR